MRRSTRISVIVLALALTVASLAGASPEISVTSPAAGSTISKATSPTMPLAGTAVFDTPVPSSTKFFLRRSQCASGNDDARLDTKKGSGEQTGCAYIAQPANEAFVATGAQEPLSTTYPAAGGLPFTLDATKPIKGVLSVTGGVGQGVIDITLNAEVGGEPVQLGKVVDTRVVQGLAAVDIAWEMAPDVALDGKDVTDLSLDVLVHGVAPNYGAVRHNGLSHFTVASYTASFSRRVEYAIDSPTFATTAKRTATLSADGTSWSAAATTPAVGNHTLYVRAIQGGETVNAANTPFTVAP